MTDPSPHSTQDDFAKVREILNRWATIGLHDALTALDRIEEQLETAHRNLDAKEAMFQQKCNEVVEGAFEYVALKEQLETRDDFLHRLRQWDMLNSYIGGDGERHEPTADAPYWRNAIDLLLESNPASGERVATGEPSRTSSQGANQSPEESSPAWKYPGGTYSNTDPVSRASNQERDPAKEPE